MPMTGARTCGSHAGAFVRTYSGFSGAEVAWLIGGCSCAEVSAGPIPTRGGFSVCTMAGRALIDGSSSAIPSSDLDLERPRVLLRVLSIPGDAVDQFRAAHRFLGQVRVRSRGGVPVDIAAVDFLRHGELVHVLLEQAPAAMLAHEPHAVGQERKGDGAVVVELHVVRVLPGLAHAVCVKPEHPPAVHA